MAARLQFLSAASEKFIREHTELEVPDDQSEECTICHESYRDSFEMRMRVTGIPACSHAFGNRCLEQWLATDLSTAKSCPLCRTVWVAEPVRPRWHLDFVSEDAARFTRETDSLTVIRTQLDRLRYERNRVLRAIDASTVRSARLGRLADIWSRSMSREDYERMMHEHDAGEARAADRAQAENTPSTRPRRNSVDRVFGPLHGRPSSHPPTRRGSLPSLQNRDPPASPPQEPETTRDRRPQPTFLSRGLLRRRVNMDFSYLRTRVDEVSVPRASLRPDYLAPSTNSHSSNTESPYHTSPDRRSHAPPADNGARDLAQYQRGLQRRAMQIRSRYAPQSDAYTDQRPARPAPASDAAPRWGTFDLVETIDDSWP
jgi:hypothetical protein